MHLAAVMAPGGTVIQLKRNTLVGDSIDVQYLINMACGLKTVFIWSSIEPIPTGHYTAHPQLVGITPQLKKFFDDMGFTFDDAHIMEIGKRCRVEYDAAIKQYAFDQRIWKAKKLIARICSFWLPGRHRRRTTRNYILRILNVR